MCVSMTNTPDSRRLHQDCTTSEAQHRIKPPTMEIVYNPPDFEMPVDKLSTRVNLSRRRSNMKRIVKYHLAFRSTVVRGAFLAALLATVSCLSAQSFTGK